MVQVDPMCQEGHPIAGFFQSNFENGTRGNQHICLVNQFVFQHRKRFLIKPWPSRKIIYAVIDPAFHGQVAHNIGNNGNRSNRHHSTFDILNDSHQLFNQQTTVDGPIVSALKPRPHSGIKDCHFPVHLGRRV